MIQEKINAQGQFFRSGKTLPYPFRLAQLKKMLKMLKQNEKLLFKALKQDLNKSKHESFTTEIGILYAELHFAIKHLKSWMEPEQVKTPITHKGTKNYILKEPYGNTLIISPWNYPVQLALAPVIAAISAGNTVILKPSELAPNTSNLLKQLIEQTFAEQYICVIEGEKETSEQLLSEKFDYIFFTGSTRVGKIVMEKASQHLTPVTLELGGKCPAIIDETANIALSAKRLVWGKYTNAGQTCVAPDYVYIHEDIYDSFMKQIKIEIKNLYGKQPLKNKQYVRIIGEKHFNRQLDLMNHGDIVMGGNHDAKSLKIEPTVIENLSWETQVMQEEIFGPILPVFKFNQLDKVLNIVKGKDKPLALYYFGSNEDEINKVLNNVSFGGGCINDCLYHLANPHLPFGGVGQSGIGNYHGKYGFQTFSHQKSIMKQTTLFDIPVRYPGGRLAFQLVKRLMK